MVRFLLCLATSMQVAAFKPAPEDVRKEVGDAMARFYKAAESPDLNSIVAMTTGDRVMAEYVQLAAVEDQLRNQLIHLRREQATARGINPATQPTMQLRAPLAETWSAAFARLNVEISADGQTARIVTRTNRPEGLLQKISGTWKVISLDPIAPVMIEYQKARNQAYRDSIAEFRAGTFKEEFSGTTLTRRLDAIETQYRDRIRAARAPTTAPAR